MEPAPAESGRPSIGAFLGAGCFSAIAGFFGGGMIAVLLAKIVGSARGCQPPDGIPACNWGEYAFAGMIAGVVILPLVSVTRLMSRRS
ncbi:MAG: hypothetical protein M3R65_10380 [Gemmatimonadota bacterium]|nr:hypothetical protein [Gemmatimonadota bacterium]